MEATTNSVRQDLELSEAHAETLTQELVDARVLASKADALSEQRQAEAEERLSLASKLEEAERLLAGEQSKVEELAQELNSLKVNTSEAEALSGRYEELSDANSRMVEERQEMETSMKSAEKRTLEVEARLKEAERLLAEERGKVVSLLQSAKESSAGSVDWQAEKQQMLEVLNEKTRELSKMGAENAQLVQSAAEVEQARKEAEKSHAEKDSMGKEAMGKLSQLVRERDLEVEALKMRNDDLVALVQKADQLQQTDNQAESLKMEVEGLRKEKDEMYAALTQKHQESLNYYAEIERLNGVLEEYKSNEANHQSKSSGVVNEKVVNDNSNEIIVLKARIRDLEKRLNVREKVPNSPPARRRFYSECVDDSKDGADVVSMTGMKLIRIKQIEHLINDLIYNMAVLSAYT